MNHNDREPEKVTRIVDFRLPLPWLLSGASAIALAMVSMWFKVDELGRNMTDMQITLKAGNSQAVSIAGEMALLRFRVENLEAERRARIEVK